MPDILPALYRVIELAAEYHDMGKLDELNQSVLNGESNRKMVNHVDAGVAFLIKKFEEYNDTQYLMAAYVILAHHIGYDDFSKIVSKIKLPIKKNRSNLGKILIKYNTNELRDHSEIIKYGNHFEEKTVCEYTDKRLSEYINAHFSLRPPFDHKPIDKNIMDKLFNFIPMRYMLSVLIDADHKDTAQNYENDYPQPEATLDPQNRLDNFNKKMDQYIKNNKPEVITKRMRQRIAIRQDLRQCASNYDFSKNNHIVYLLNGVVGSGKTHSGCISSLRIADAYNLRAINCVVPFIALVDQSYNNCKNLLCIENIDKEINIIHSMVDYENGYIKKYAKGLNSPVNMMTSKSFMDIFTVNETSVIRNFHKLLGTVTIFDEFDATADIEYWGLINPLLHDMNKFGSCKFIMSSGTPSHYWEIDDLLPYFEVEKLSLSDKKANIVSEELYHNMLDMEKERLTIDASKCQIPIDFEILKNKILEKNGSIFVVFNTAFKTCEFSKYLKQFSNKKVMCRYAGLSPEDRSVSYEKLKIMMKEEDIILVATDGSDIGLDLSFHHGFKEASGYRTAIQIGGRINRNFEFEDSTLYIFSLVDYPLNNGVRFYNNAGLRASTYVYKSNIPYYSSHSPVNCTHFIKMELEHRKINPPKQDLPIDIKINDFQKKYRDLDFNSLDESFQIIPNIQVPILVNLDLFKNIENGSDVPYNKIQKNSINRMLSDKKINALINSQKMERIDKMSQDDLAQYGEKYIKKYSKWYVWLGDYDNDLGIMKDNIWQMI